jgi:hypothetical protein
MFWKLRCLCLGHANVLLLHTRITSVLFQLTLLELLELLQQY